MRALIVVAHPDPGSPTHAVATTIANAVKAAGAGHEASIADLAAEGFDPRHKADDLAFFRGEAKAPADVLAEQARIDRADALVLVFPVHWWSMPAQMKGWIDRVFTGGWAFNERPDGSIEKMLGRLAVHVVAIGGADEGVYDRHGYAEAMRTQIDHGIFGYCGARVRTSDLLTPSGEPFLDRAESIGRAVVSG
ncbi:NAD(P)H-dependent oxidoreductase [Hansschlegelia beijingensis]|uniref:NAD(P)H-dependent oxidoreductase n=1 Tax=Hansschlegelia beijingensis TaxID=1133344 RepID=UPI00387EF2B4